jgi:hypothetical protein
MVDRLDADDPGLESVVVPLQVPEKMQLGLRGTHEEDLGVAFEGARDFVEEAKLIVRMIPDSHLLVLGVTMNVGSGGVDDRGADGLGVDCEDARLLVIDPHDCVTHGALLVLERSCVLALGIGRSTSSFRATGRSPDSSASTTR